MIDRTIIDFERGFLHMTEKAIDAVRGLRRAGFVLIGSLLMLPNDVDAQRVGGSAYGASVKTLFGTTQSPMAALSESGGYSLGESETFAAPAVSAKWLSAVSTGSVGSNQEPWSSQSVSEVEEVSVLNGLIRADNVTTVASSYTDGTSAASNADGSGFVNLVVNGVSLAADVAPNTRVNLLGVGYVVLNEQKRTGDGVGSSGITVNMIHVYLLDGREIVVGSGSSRVSP
jgi:hypothetical protein